jgi:phosphoglycerol transferase MdoB-like AlkP superfamily enzyme
MFTVLRLVFYCSNHTFFPDYPVGIFSKAMLVGMRSDLQSIAIFFLPFIVLHLLPFKWQNSDVVKYAAKWICLLTAFAVMLISLVETAYFPFSFQRMHAGSFRLAGDSPLIYFLGRFWHLIIILLVMSLVLFRLYGTQKMAAIPGKRGYLIWLCILVGIWLLAFTSGRKRPVMPSDLGLSLPANATILATNTQQHMLFTWYLNKFRNRHMLERKDYMTDAEADRLYSIFHYPESDRSFKPYNVVIFVLESFSRSYLEPGHPNKAFSPFLDSLRSESLVCSNAFANASISLGGLTAIMGGIPPVTAASHMESPYTHNFIEPFFQLLNQRGYHTTFFYGGSDDHFGFKRMSRQLGFKGYYSGEDLNEKRLHDGVWGIYDGPFFAYAEEKISGKEPPFASVIFNLSSHFPYRIPKEYADKLPKGTLNSHQSIAYVDLCLKQFFDAARKRDWFDNTIFVFVADHWSKEDNAQKGEGPYRYTIPLMIYLPDGSVCGVQDRVVDQLSVIPTLADIMNFPDPYMSFGSSLLNTSKTAYSYGLLEFPHLYHIISDSFTLQYDEKHDQVAGLYAYREHGGMKRNLADSLPQISRIMERQLKAFIQVHHNRMLDNQLVPPRP